MSSSSHFTHQVRVYYEDTDFSGVVYHASHLRFFERGRTEALRATGVHHSKLLKRDPPLAFVVRKMNIEWASPARIDDVLDVQTQFVNAKGARFWLHQELWRDQDLIARAEVEAACISLDGRPQRMPREIIERLTAAAPSVSRR